MEGTSVVHGPELQLKMLRGRTCWSSNTERPVCCLIVNGEMILLAGTRNALPFKREVVQFGGCPPQSLKWVVASLCFEVTQTFSTFVWKIKGVNSELQYGSVGSRLRVDITGSTEIWERQNVVRATRWSVLFRNEKHFSVLNRTLYAWVWSSE